MYPDFQFLISSITGSEAPQWLSLFKVFGFFVALAFIAGTYVLYLELKRKEKEGLIGPKTIEETKGKKATPTDYFWSGVIGFIVLYKIVGLFTQSESATMDPMSYFISLKGNMLAGLTGLVIGIAYKYQENKKTALAQPITKKVLLYPHQRISEIIMIAAIGGMVGAKLFNALETWDSFIQDPIGSLISSSGLTFYGGLILATFLLWRFAKRNGINFAHLCDAAAPALILAYGVGRLGCHFSGDGDWGIFNSAYVSNADGSLREVPKETFDSVTVHYQKYFARDFAQPNQIPHLYKPSGGLPTWMYGMNYANNVNNEGVMIEGCKGYYCSMLPVSVFPTSFYEFIMCMILFGALWLMRRKYKLPWQIFGLYLIFNGLERFFIEKIRVNYKYDLGFIHPTQAEIISVCLVLIGLYLLIRKPSNKKIKPA